MIAIRSGAAVVEVTPEACGAVTRFAWLLPNRSIEWPRPANGDAVKRAFPQGMARFPIVPFSNRIRNGKFTFRGQTISLPPNFSPAPHAIHGDGWRTKWNTVAHDPDRAVIEYVHAPSGWPFAYRARQTLRLETQALVLEMAVKSEGQTAMPPRLLVSPLLYPYARRAPADGRCRAAGERRAVHAQPDRRPPGLDGLKPYAVQLDNNFIGWSGRAGIDRPEWHASLEISTEGPFACFVIYTPPGERYFCAKPTTNCIDAFNLAAQGRHDTAMLVLEPGQQINGRVHLVPSLAG